MYLFLSFVLSFLFMFYPTLVAICRQDWYNVGKVGLLNIALVLVSLVIPINFYSFIDVITLLLFVFSYLMLCDEKEVDTKF